MVNLGKKIKQARKEIGLTQKELAKIMDVHWNTIARWERDEIECRIDQLLRIADLTKRPISWFFGEVPEAEGKVYMQVDGNKFRYCREKNNYSIKEIAVLLELPEKVIRDIEKGSAPLEMEYFHRMIFVLGYPVSWFFTDESNKEWIENDKAYERWLDAGRSNWKFQEHFYNLWEQEKIQPKPGFDDMKNWLNSYKMWNSFFKKIELANQGEGESSKPTQKELSNEDKKTLKNLKSLAENLSKGTKSEIDFFIKQKREREKFRKMRNESSRGIPEIGKRM